MSYSTVNYGTDSGLKKDDGENFDTKSGKALKYYTTNWNSVLKDDAGINFVEGFGKPAGFTDKESQLIRSTITNPKIRQNFGFLPFATTGGLPNSGPVISEQNGRERRSCQPMDTEYYKRSFYDLTGHMNVTEKENKAGEDTRQIGRKSANGRS